MAIAPLRRGLPINTPRERPPSPREVARWITTAPSRRSLHAADARQRLFEHCPELDRGHDLVRQFAAMLDARDAAPLPGWLEQLTVTRLPALASLANTIRGDQPAVVQGITTPFNSGLNEGRITDLKLQKRIMAGRPRVPLLRLAASEQGHEDDALSEEYADSARQQGSGFRACRPRVCELGRFETDLSSAPNRYP